MADGAIRDLLDQHDAGLDRLETIKQFRILPRELSVEAGEMAPSLKIKRAVVARNFADLIESIYSTVPSESRPREPHRPNQL